MMNDLPEGQTQSDQTPDGAASVLSDVLGVLKSRRWRHGGAGRHAFACQRMNSQAGGFSPVLWNDGFGGWLNRGKNESN